MKLRTWINWMTGLAARGLGIQSLKLPIIFGEVKDDNLHYNFQMWLHRWEHLKYETWRWHTAHLCAEDYCPQTPQGFQEYQERGGQDVQGPCQHHQWTHQEDQNQRTQLDFLVELLLSKVSVLWIITSVRFVVCSGLFCKFIMVFCRTKGLTNLFIYNPRCKYYQDFKTTHQNMFRSMTLFNWYG